jgi:hypothetical protein
MLLLVGNSPQKRSLEFEDDFAKPRQDKRQISIQKSYHDNIF